MMTGGASVASVVVAGRSGGASVDVLVAPVEVVVVSVQVDYHKM